MALTAEELLEQAREMLEMVNLCFATSVVSETEGPFARSVDDRSV